MTVAVCFNCGEIKFGAFNHCGKCGTRPISEDDLARSYAMTDHHYDKSTLEQIAYKIKIGDPPQLDPETRENIVVQLRNSGMLKMMQASDKMNRTDRPPQKKPWWKIF
jgi:hypothetical protein